MLLSSNITFLTHDGGTWVFRERPEYKGVNKFATIEIGNNCFVGWGVTLMPGVKIGNNCVIGAGSLVTKNIPAGEVWAGVPARFITTTEEYALKCKNRPGNISIPEGANKREVLMEALIYSKKE